VKVMHNDLNRSWIRENNEFLLDTWFTEENDYSNRPSIWID